MPRNIRPLRNAATVGTLKERSSVCQSKCKQLFHKMLRAYRRRAGLSQRELGVILGYTDDGEVSRHERSKTLPPLITALAYAAVFRVGVSGLFPEVHAEIVRTIEANLAVFEKQLQAKSGKGRGAASTARKLTWINERKATA